MAVSIGCKFTDPLLTPVSIFQFLFNTSPLVTADALAPMTDVRSLFINETGRHKRDWDHPEARLGTDEAPEVILEQFTRYYSWLFEPKPSIKPEKYLKLLEQTKIPKHINKMLDADLTRSEISEAIDSL